MMVVVMIMMMAAEDHHTDRVIQQGDSAVKGIKLIFS